MELKPVIPNISALLSSTFNQTRMELKHKFSYVALFIIHSLLIRPEWNWNISWSLVPHLLHRLLIRPEWNWNYDYDDKYFKMLNAFNQTRMELKHGCQMHHCESHGVLLIRPEWNWNPYGIGESNKKNIF